MRSRPSSPIAVESPLSTAANSGVAPTSGSVADSRLQCVDEEVELHVGGPFTPQGAVVVEARHPFGRRHRCDLVEEGDDGVAGRSRTPRRQDRGRLVQALGTPAWSFSITLSMLKLAGSWLRRELLERLQHAGHVDLGRHEHPDVVEEPVEVGVRRGHRPLVRVGAQVEEPWHPQLGVRLGPDVQRAVGALLHEHDLPVVVAQRGEVAVVGHVEEVLPGARRRWRR